MLLKDNRPNGGFESLLWNTELIRMRFMLKFVMNTCLLPLVRRGENCRSSGNFRKGLASESIICAVMQEYEISRDEAQSGFSAFVSTLMKDGYITESE